MALRAGRDATSLERACIEPWAEELGPHGGVSELDPQRPSRPTLTTATEGYNGVSVVPIPA